MSGEQNAGIVIGILIVIDGRPFADRSTRISIPIRKPMSRRAECRYPHRYRWRDPVGRSTRISIPIRKPMSGEQNAGILIGILIVIDGATRLGVRSGFRSR
jgi:hypothetical protein